MNDPIHDDEWVLIDTETTGLYPPVYVVEIAAQLFRGFVPVGPAFQAIVDPGVPIPPDATAIHGYTDEYIRRHGVSSAEAYSRLANFVAHRRIAAHYARFDWDTVLLPQSQRLGLEPWAKLGFCTWALARRALPESPTHRLDVLRSKYGLRGVRAHTALGDVDATTDLLTRIIFPRLAAVGFPTIQEVAYFSRLLPLQLCHQIALRHDEPQAQKRLASLQQDHREQKVRARKLKKYLEELELGYVSLIDAIREYGFIDEHPVVEFKNRRFLFTGKLAMGARATAQAAVVERGGLVAKSASNTVDYLVLGAESWRELERGGKLTAAVLRRLKGMPNPILVLEEDFIVALNEQAATHEPLPSAG